MTTYADERVLEDNYPLHWGYLYVVGDRVFKNKPGFATVKEMRDELVKLGLEQPGVVIKSCNISARNLWEHMV